MIKFLTQVFAVILVFTLVACGGGGDSDSDNNDGDTTTSDTTPDAFNFTDQTDVALNAQITSNSITVAGINAASPISITGGEYQVDSGAYTSAAGTVSNGQTVTVRHTSSTSVQTATDSILSIGGVSDTFTSTTTASTTADTTPDAFSFTDQTNVALNTQVTSNSITVTGINTVSPISITGGEYQIGSGAYTTAAGAVSNGQAVDGTTHLLGDFFKPRPIVY